MLCRPLDRSGGDMIRPLVIEAATIVAPRLTLRPRFDEEDVRPVARFPKGKPASVYLRIWLLSRSESRSKT
jgi:hypothetical protein